jgi:pimeloyl-ACP methyl ester carboxylesterase
MTPSSARQIRPFAIAISDEVLADLHRRLDTVRWPDAELVDDWSQGMPLAYTQDLVDYWNHNYDWRSREALLNRFDQFMITLDAGDVAPESNGLANDTAASDAPISDSPISATRTSDTAAGTTAAGDAASSDPIDIHFIHQRSSHTDATPLLITHGWPGSIIEFQRVIEPLTEPTRFGGLATDAFHVIAPSLPGFGFSPAPRHPGCGAERIAALWAQLMQHLGYDRYLAQGGDWGSAITSLLGAIDPEHCSGIHVTMAMTARPKGPPTEADELRAIERLQHYLKFDSGYSTQQKTRPQTLGYGLADSPTGQLAWIVEKYWAWAHHDGDPADVLGRDEMLDNVMLYWCANTATSSARLYWESFMDVARLKVEVPTGVAVYANEIVPPVRSWMQDLFPNIVHWQNYERGGHFAAWEVPDTFVADLRAWRTAVLG